MTFREQFLSIPNALTGRKWWSLPGLRKLNWFISVVYVSQMLNGIDDGITGNMQERLLFEAFPAWHEALGNPSASAIGLLNAAAYISGLCTAPFITYVADRWGRRWCIRWNGLMGVIGTAIGCGAGASGGGYALFIVSRVVWGSGLAAHLICGPILIQELAHPFQRDRAAALFNPNYAIGGFLLAWVTFGTSYMGGHWGWRLPYLLQLPLALYLFIAAQFLPETPRWLMSKGREEEALEMLVKYHGEGDANDELVLFEFEEMKDALRKEKELKQDTWREIFGKKGNRHRLAIVLLIVICQNLSGTAIIGQYFTVVLANAGVTGTTKQTGVNVGLTATVWLGAMCGFLLVNRVKRRNLLIGVWSTLLVVSVAFTVTAARYEQYGEESAGLANVAMLFLYDFVFFLVCGPLFFSYQYECLSYSMRAKGALIWGVANKLISIFNAYVNSIALDRIGWKYYIVYNCLLFAQLIALYFLAVETKGYTLEEIAVLFDGGAAAPDVNAAPFEASAHAGLEKKAITTAGVKEADSDSVEK
ncbi:hypothetical protein JCM11251_001872 [Rhodosporidiobolus azoricus]